MQKLVILLLNLNSRANQVCSCIDTYRYMYVNVLTVLNVAVTVFCTFLFVIFIRKCQGSIGSFVNNWDNYFFCYNIYNNLIVSIGSDDENC